MTDFSGKFTQKVDPKGRVCVSGKLLSCLQDEAERWFRICPGDPVVAGSSSALLFLRLIPESEYHDWAEWTRPKWEGARDPRTREEKREARRFLGDVEKVKLDAQGRFTLPPQLRDAAGIEGEALLHGDGLFV